MRPVVIAGLVLDVTNLAGETVAIHDLLPDPRLMVLRPTAFLSPSRFTNEAFSREFQARHGAGGARRWTELSVQLSV
jgi:hypothetical protein